MSATAVAMGTTVYAIVLKGFVPLDDGVRSLGIYAFKDDAQMACPEGMKVIPVVVTPQVNMNVTTGG